MIRALSLLLITACATRATGTVAGRTFNGAQAWATPTSADLTLSIEETVNRCQAGGAPANRYRLVVRLSEWSGTALLPATKAGTYTIVSKYCRDEANGLYADCSVSSKKAPAGSLYALAQYERDGEQTPLDVLSGSVTFTTLSAQPGGTMEGAFQVFVDPADKLSGNFTGSVCDISE